MQSIAELATALTSPRSQYDTVEYQSRKANRVLWLKLNFTVKTARLQTLKRQKYQHLQEEALLKARGLLKNWENGVVVLTEDLYRRAAGERDAQELMNYTPEALALRFSLRNDPQVLEAVKQLWQIEMARDPLGCIDQRGYASVFRRVAKSLDEKEFKKKQKLDRLLDDDWKRDSKGESSMSFANFFDSIFELADLWCETINVGDYVELLERLRDRISQVRQGKRVFKPLGKVLAFDADSDEEEEEEEEEDSDEDEPSERVKPKTQPAPAVQPRLLVTKAIRPTPQPQKQPLNLLGKVTRVATPNKPVRRTPATDVVPVEAKTPIVATTQSEIVVPTATNPSSGAQSSESAMPLSTLQSTASQREMPSRQRRASVVTTIQFLDDGFVHSIKDGLGAGGFHSNGQQQSFSRQSSLAQAAAAQRDQGLRPSLATTASFALGRPTNRPSGQISGAFHEDLASINEGPQAAKSSLDRQQSSAERKRVITISTAKKTILKSIVFATGWKAGALRSTPIEEEGESRTDASGGDSDGAVGVVENTSHDDNTLVESAATAIGNQSNGGKPGISNGIAVRVRTASVFSGNGTLVSTSAFSKGVRQGLVAASRTRNALTPLGSPGLNGAANGLGASGGNANPSKTVTMKLNTITQTIMTQGSGGIDFSDSVLMSSYAVERPTPTSSQSYRPPKVLRPNTNVVKTLPLGPVLDGQTGGHEHGMIRGQRAIPKQILQAQHPQPEVARPTETEGKKPMTVILNKPPPVSETLPPSTGQPHRYVGHALHAQSPSKQGGHALEKRLAPVSNGPEGSPEQAIRIKAALDNTKDIKEHGSAVRVDHWRVYDHTEPDALLRAATSMRPHEVPHKAEPHGMFIQPDTIPMVSSLSKARGHLMDPQASPWDTFDDDDDGDVMIREGKSSVSSARSLLQPESATEALAKMISKRAASLSAGATRASGRRKVASSAKRPRSRPDSSSLYSGRERDKGNGEEDVSGEDNYTYREQEQPPTSSRARLLTVSSLGGSSVESRASDHQRAKQHVLRRGSRDFDELNGMEEAVASRVPVTPSSLELNCSPPRSIAKSRGVVSSQNTTRERRPSLVRTPQQGAGMSIDDMELRGEQAFDSPPRSPATRATSPPKKCTCSRSHEPEFVDGEQLTTSSYPPPMYRLDSMSIHRDDNGEDHDQPASPDGRCVLCSKLRDADVTIILNAKRELTLEPISKELDVITQAAQGIPRRSEMMRRRHRYTRGKHL